MGSIRRLTLLVESLKTSKVKMRPDPILSLTITIKKVADLLLVGVAQSNKVLSILSLSRPIVRFFKLFLPSWASRYSYYLL